MIRRWLDRIFGQIDAPLMAVVSLLVITGLIVLFSATYDQPARFYDQLRNIGVAIW